MDDYSLLKLTPLDITDEDSIADVLLAIDMSIQYGEDAEVKDNYPNEDDDEEEGRQPRAAQQHNGHHMDT